MEKESEKILTNFRERIISLAGLKFALLKLNACERAAKISAALAHSILVLVLGLFAILFIFFRSRIFPKRADRQTFPGFPYCIFNLSHHPFHRLLPQKTGAACHCQSNRRFHPR